MNSPLTVYMELTRDCNLSCSHCLIKKEKVEMNVKKAKTLLDQLVKEHVFKVYFTGGEPLLFPGLYELLEHIKGKPLWSLMQTNGLLITDNVAEALKNAGLGACDLSVYGITPEVHDSITGSPGSFEKVFSAVDTLNAHGMKTFISFVVVQPNVHQLSQFLDWAFQKGIPLVHIRRFIPRYSKDELVPDMDTVRSFFREYSPRYEEYDKKGLHFEIEEAFKIQEVEKDRCPAGIQLCHVTAEGNITPCPYIDVQGESVFEQGFHPLWENSSLLQKARNAIISKGKCEPCEYASECGGGCIAAAYRVTGTFEEPDPYCLVHPDSV